MTAWIMPPAVLLLGALLAVLLVRRWNRTRKSVAGIETPDFVALQQEIRKETEI